MLKEKKCSHCGQLVRDNEKFCAHCGTKIDSSDAQKICESCGTVNNPFAVFCVTCGTELRSEKTAAGAPSKRAESAKEKKSTEGSITAFKNIFIIFAVLVAAIIIYEVLQAPGAEIVRNGSTQSQMQNQTAPQNAETLQRISELEARLKTSPNDQEAMLELANRLHDAHFFPRAVEAYKKYLTANPKDADARVDMGICYFENGNFEQAVKEIEQVIKQSPKHQMAMFNLGVMYLNQGDMEKSNKWLAQCADLDSSTEVGKKALQILKQHKLN
ncbi:MAG: tetratricopeptide repeat protein [Bacteroidetes bacterium]|nr:tetratricopeptide repeat protein [Bacteroidota bacterium]